MEKRVIEIIEEHDLPLKYTGKGSKVIGNKIPDFIFTNRVKAVLEVFGTPWHDPEDTFKEDIPYHQTEEGTKEYYKKNGYKCVILWDEEIKKFSDREIVKRIKNIS